MVSTTLISGASAAQFGDFTYTNAASTDLANPAWIPVLTYNKQSSWPFMNFLVNNQSDSLLWAVRGPRRSNRVTGSLVSRERARSISNSATQSLWASGSTSIC